jgi:hypothetical protein
VRKVSALSKLVEQLDHLDPMPWNQVILLGVAFSVLILMAVLGDFVS